MNIQEEGTPLFCVANMRFQIKQTDYLSLNAYFRNLPLGIKSIIVL